VFHFLITSLFLINDRVTLYDALDPADVPGAGEGGCAESENQRQYEWILEMHIGLLTLRLEF